jgi:hypothetical protein
MEPRCQEINMIHRMLGIAAIVGLLSTGAESADTTDSLTVGKSKRNISVKRPLPVERGTVSKLSRGRIYVKVGKRQRSYRINQLLMATSDAPPKWKKLQNVKPTLKVGDQVDITRMLGGSVYVWRIPEEKKPTEPADKEPAEIPKESVIQSETDLNETEPQKTTEDEKRADQDNRPEDKRKNAESERRRKVNVTRQEESVILSEEDQKLIEQDSRPGRKRRKRWTKGDMIALARQKICPVSRVRIGDRERAVKTTINAWDIYVCCPHCIAPLQADPQLFLSLIPGEPPMPLTTLDEAGEAAVARQKLLLEEVKAEKARRQAEAKAKAEKSRRQAEARAKDTKVRQKAPSNNATKTGGKVCSACGRSVPMSSRAGEFCPYCKTYWSSEGTTDQKGRKGEGSELSPATFTIGLVVVMIIFGLVGYLQETNKK